MNAICLVDLGFGDAGKGSIVDALAREHSENGENILVVRYNGGPQAAHRVVAGEWGSHIFSQIGAASYLPRAQTFLSRYMLVNPLNLDREIDAFGSFVLKRIIIDERAVVVTPYHVAINRFREIVRGGVRHGSCGQGVGATRDDQLNRGIALTVGDLRNVIVTRRILAKFQYFYQEEYRKLAEDPVGHAALVATYDDLELDHRVLWSEYSPEDIARRYRAFTLSGLKILSAEASDRLVKSYPGTLIFEGAQGVLLDELHGFHPYTTWTDTTLRNAESLLEGYGGDIMKLGILRAYAVRHGPGPLPTEGTAVLRDYDETNVSNTWQGQFRTGAFDMVLTKYALAVQPVDALVITCLDHIPAQRSVAGMGNWVYCEGYKKHAQTNGTVPIWTVGRRENLRVWNRNYVAMNPPTQTEMVLNTKFLQTITRNQTVRHFVSLRKQEFAADYIGDLLQMPIGMISSGAQAKDKQIRMRRLKKAEKVLV